MSGAVALAGILLISFAPTLGELAVLVSLTLFVNGPYSMFLPTAHEPILMVFGRLYPPVLVAALATTGTIAAEYVNYRLYVAMLSAPGLRRLPDTPLGRRVSAWFRVQPFLTVVLCALGPIPFWIARILASMTQYPMRRYLAAVALGRFPRQWFYAAVGLFLPLTNQQLLAIGLGATLLLAIPIVLRQRRAGAAVAAPVRP
ncbi:MAG: VTT domain-containing protein [Gemmatimonadales bacterium]